MIARRDPTPTRPRALVCGVLALCWCAVTTVEAAFVSPFPSFGGAGSRGKARAAVVLEPRSSTGPAVALPPAPSIYSAASGQGDPEEPAVRPKKSKKEEERKNKHFEFLKVRLTWQAGRPGSGARHVGGHPRANHHHHHPGTKLNPTQLNPTHSTLQEVAQNKKQARANKAKFRDQRDEYLEEMRKAFKLMQIKEREESGFKWVKRPKRDRQIPLKELKLGAKHDGVVITVKEHGAYVDFGAKKDGFVRLRDMSDTDFVLDARDFVRPGDSVEFYVKYVSPEEGIVTGSLVPADIETAEEQEARTPLADVQDDDELWGEVTKVSNYGAFVDVGVEVQGFLHIIYYPKRYQGALTQEVFTPGQRLRVWAMEVDTEKRRLKLTAERPRTLPRVDYSWFMGGYEVDGDPEAPGAATTGGEEDDEALYATSYEEGQGLQARGRGKRAMERMRDWKWEEDGKRGGETKEAKEVVHDLDARPRKEEEEAAE